MKIVTNISDLILYKLDANYEKIAKELNKISREAKEKELELVLLEKRKIELEWELREIEVNIVEYTLKGKV